MRHLSRSCPGQPAKQLDGLRESRMPGSVASGPAPSTLCRWPEPPATIFELVSRTGAELVSVELVLGGERWL
jgi:hypothetical protein